MSTFNITNIIVDQSNVDGTAENDLIIGTQGQDDLDGKAGDDLIFGLDDDDKILGGLGKDTIFGGEGEDEIFGNQNEDTLIGNKGNDQMFGGLGNDTMVWNNGDGSDLMHGGFGHDRTQVNFQTDLVDDDLQNKDVAEYSVTDQGVKFARIEVNDQTEAGLFELDIRETEVLETNFGGGDDTAKFKDNVLEEIELELDGGAGVDTLDFSEADGPVVVDLRDGTMTGGTAVNFENVIGTDQDDTIFGNQKNNVISGGDGEDELHGRRGNDTLIGNKGNDQMFGGLGNDTMVWNNGDGSDLMHGGFGHDRTQVNFQTDLVDDDLQNKDVAEYSVTDQGVKFARIEVNDQTEAGLFELDIRETEVLETNFGGGDDTAKFKDNVLEEIELELDGGAGVDTLDFSEADGPVVVDLRDGTMTGGTAVNFENVIGTDQDDTIFGNQKNNVISGGDGEDELHGRRGNDTLIGNKGNDQMFGGLGNDTMVWNNGDGSDLMHGGFGHDRTQVNFQTDLVDDDLQNKDVAEYSVTDQGVKFARIEVNDQTEAGLFELDIRETEVLETNFGGGDDTAVIVDNVIGEIELQLDGGAGRDTLDFSQADGPVAVDLRAGTIEIDNGAGVDATAVNFEIVTGTDSNDVLLGGLKDNVIRGGKGNDIMDGRGGADTFVFFEEDIGVDVILNFQKGVDKLLFVTSDPEVTADNLLDDLTQVGDDVELSVNGKDITFEDALVADFSADDFMIA